MCVAMLQVLGFDLPAAGVALPAAPVIGDFDLAARDPIDCSECGRRCERYDDTWRCPGCGLVF